METLTKVYSTTERHKYSQEYIEPLGFLSLEIVLGLMTTQQLHPTRISNTKVKH